MAKLRAALMDLRLLQSFVTVVEEGSLSAASKRRVSAGVRVLRSSACHRSGSFASSISKANWN